MTRTPPSHLPGALDLAKMAREIVAEIIKRTYLPSLYWRSTAEAVVAEMLPQSHAAGLEERRSTLVDIHDALVDVPGTEKAFEIIDRALASSAPEPDRVAETQWRWAACRLLNAVKALIAGTVGARQIADDAVAEVTALISPDQPCAYCKGSQIEEVYAGYGNVAEVPCSMCNGTGTSPSPSPGLAAQEVERLREENAGWAKAWDKQAERANNLEIEVERLTEERDEVFKLADSALFHQLGCMGGCHESLASLARLAKAIGYKTDPWEQEELDAALNSPRDRGKTHDCYRDEQRDFKARADTLAVALRDVLADIRDYERVNNLSPNPGRKNCWDSVTRAIAALAAGEPG